MGGKAVNKLSQLLRNRAISTDEYKMKKMYLICFGIIIALTTLGDTTFWMPPRIPLRIIWLCELIIAYKIFFVDFWLYDEKKEYIMCLLITVAIFIFSKYTLPLEIMALVLGARGVSFDKILKIWLIISAIIISAAYISSVLGIIEDIKYEAGEITRHSLGIIYPTNFGGHVFFIMAASTYFLNKNKIIWPVCLFLPLIASVYYYSHARLAVGGMILLILGYFILHIGKLEKNNQISILLRYFTKCSIIGIPFICFTVSILYTPENNLLVQLDNWLSGRVNLSHTGLVDYAITLFGQKIEFVTFGSPKLLEGVPYFYIDSSYIKIFMLYGISGFLLFQMLFYKMYRRLCKNQWLTYLLFVIAVNGAIDSFIYQVQYCPFLLSAYAVINDDI